MSVARQSIVASASLAEKAHDLGIDPSTAPQGALVEATRRKRSEIWLEENREAIETYNELVATHGVFSAGLRGF